MSSINAQILYHLPPLNVVRDRVQAALDLVKAEDTLKAEEKPLARDIRRSCNLNLAAAYLRENDHKGALEATTQVGFTTAVPVACFLNFKQSLSTVSI